MARKGTTAAVAATDSTDAGAAAGTGTPTPTTSTASSRGGRRGPNDPQATIYWNGDRDKALMILLLQNPGRLTSAAVAVQLAKHPAFADEAHLMGLPSTPDKIRQRVAKLNGDSEAIGKGSPFQLKRLNNSGYDRQGVVAEVLAAMAAIGGGAGVQVPVQAQEPQPQVALSNVPTSTIATAPVAAVGQPQFLGSVGGTGLIPTPQ